MISIFFFSLILSLSAPVDYNVMYVRGNLQYCGDEGVCNFSTYNFEIIQKNKIFEILMNDSLIEYNDSNKKILPLINLFKQTMILYSENLIPSDTIITNNIDTLKFENNVLTRIVYYRNNLSFVFGIDSFSINIH